MMIIIRALSHSSVATIVLHLVGHGLLLLDTLGSLLIDVSLLLPVEHYVTQVNC